MSERLSAVETIAGWFIAVLSFAATAALYWMAVYRPPFRAVTTAILFPVINVLHAHLFSYLFAHDDVAGSFIHSTMIFVLWMAAATVVVVIGGGPTRRGSPRDHAGGVHDE